MMIDARTPVDSAWYAVWTRSHCEQLVTEQLQAKGFSVFLPKVLRWARSARGRCKAERILFPGYLFVDAVLDKRAHAAILESRGVVRVLGDGWDRLARVPEEEMHAVRRMTAAAGAFAHDVPIDGDRVRITGGPLQGLEGWFIRARPARGLFVISVTLLHRSVAVEVDAAHVEAAWS
jgi:transcription antitermination factor NusG